MIRRFAALAAVFTCVVAWPASALAGGPSPIKQFGPGAPGIGDPYFPLDGNGGYDVQHYVLDLAYDPATDVLTGVGDDHGAGPRRTCRSFNLDLDGLTRPVDQGQRRAGATWSRDGGELTVTPGDGPARSTGASPRSCATTACPSRSATRARRLGLHPHRRRRARRRRSRTWPPPGSRSTTTRPTRRRTRSAITVPDGPRGGRQRRARGAAAPSDGWTTWTWDAQEPMASYLATATIGEFDLRAYREDGIAYWDAIDPDLFDADRAPRTGEQFALSQVGRPVVQAAGPHDQRARRRRASCRSGSTRDTEPDWDFVFVEAHTVGAGRLDDAARPERPHQPGHRRSSARSGSALHPFLAHYQTDNGDGTCAPDRARPARGGRPAAPATATSSGRSTCPPTPAATSRCRSATPATTSSSAAASSSTTSSCPTGAGHDLVRGRRRHARRLDRARARPRAARPNANDWIVGHRRRRAADRSARSPTARSPASRRSSTSSSGIFGRYPFSAAGGIVDDADELGFALENQTRPIYSQGLLRRPGRAATAWSCTSWPTSGSATASRVAALAAHLAQRGLRHLRGVAVERARRARHRPGDLRLLLRRHPGRRPVLDADDRRSRAGPPVRHRRLLAAAR